MDDFCDRLVEEVKKMRKMQKHYFRTRHMEVLKVCKEQERLVDKMVENYGVMPQGDLF